MSMADQFNSQYGQAAPGGGQTQADKFNATQPQSSRSIPQLGSDLLRFIGLGAIPNTAANLTDIGSKLLSGQGPQLANPFSSSVEQSAAQNVPQNYSNPFRTRDEMVRQLGQNPALSAAQDTAGAAAWGVPMGAESGIATSAPGLGELLSNAPGAIPAISNLATSGALSGGLNAFSQLGATPGSVGTGTALGAIANPLIYGAGHLLTDTIPRYLGMRAYGTAGKDLPDVIKAEQAAGGDSLKEVRAAILDQTGGNKVDRDEVLGMIDDLAKQDQWVGTPGVDSKSVNGARGGAVGDIRKAFNSSEDLFDFYSRVKNMAYSDAPSQFSKKDQFLVSAAGKIREYLIQNSTDPEALRNAMDMYAAQTAMNKGASVAGSSMGNTINKLIGQNPSQAGEAGLATVLAAIPGFHALTMPLLADAALTNRFVGPKIAEGLVNLGQTPILPSLLQRLGVNLAGAASTPRP